MLLERFLASLVEVGSLMVVFPDGKERYFGGSKTSFLDLPSVRVRLTDRSLLWNLCLFPDPALGEAYMNGSLVFEQGDIWDLLVVLGVNAALNKRNISPQRKISYFFGGILRFLQQMNNPALSRKNVSRHYDLSNSLYRLFLDDDLQYTCAYFLKPDDTLSVAQQQKKQHIARKLLLEPGQQVVDIGCGWGGLALYLAAQYDVDVLGITLAAEQLKVAQDRAEAAGLSKKVRFELLDYRKLKGKFDRVVSVGMFEHVGSPHFVDFFDVVSTILEEDGVALLHSMARMEPPSSTSPFIHKYIFPRGYIPALSEVMSAVERTKLWISDTEILRLHYAKTLRLWRENFIRNWDKAADLYDDAFCRMWNFYLAASEASFRYGAMLVFQMQLAKKVDAAPLTRNYMMDMLDAGQNDMRVSMLSE